MRRIIMIEWAGTGPARSSIAEPKVEFDIPRLVRLRIAELSEGGAGKTGGQAPQQMAVGEIESRAAEFQCLLLSKMEGLGDREVLIQLHGLPKLRDGGGEVTVNHIRRLDERILVDIGAGRILRVPTGIQQGLAGNQATACVACAKQILSATDSKRRAALVPLDTRYNPVSENPIHDWGACY